MSISDKYNITISDIYATGLKLYRRNKTVMMAK